jgi:hypothetical protein
MENCAVEHHREEPIVKSDIGLPGQEGGNRTVLFVTEPVTAEGSHTLRTGRPTSSDWQDGRKSGQEPVPLQSSAVSPIGFCYVINPTGFTSRNGTSELVSRRTTILEEFPSQCFVPQTVFGYPDIPGSQ